MRKISVAIGLLFITMSLNAQDTEFVKTSGQAIVTSDGKELLICGTNLGNWLVPEGYMFKFSNATSPRLINGVLSEMIGPEETRKFWEKFQDVYITREDIAYIKELGFNTVRVPFHFALFSDDEYLNMSRNRGFELMDRVIQWCEEEGLYVILDMHCAPGGQTGDNIDDSWGYPWLFDSPEKQMTTVGIWMRIAEHYQDNTIVIGYDLLNEPIAHYFDTERLNPKLEPLYKRIVEAIRSVDENHMIFLGGAQWNSNFDVFGPPFDDNLVYTFHKYWTDTTQAVIQDYLDFREKYNVPLFMGESGENTDEWIRGFRHTLERNNVGWTFWPYKKMDSESCIIQFEQPEAYEVISNYADSVRASYGDIRELRPPVEEVHQALDAFLENARFERNTTNEGYVRALLE